MIELLVTRARQQTLWWWAGYALYAAAFIGVGVLWLPHMVPFAMALVVANLFIVLASTARRPARHRRKQPGTEHLAE